MFTYGKIILKSEKDFNTTTQKQTYSAIDAGNITTTGPPHYSLCVNPLIDLWTVTVPFAEMWEDQANIDDSTSQLRDRVPTDMCSPVPPSEMTTYTFQSHRLFGKYLSTY